MQESEATALILSLSSMLVFKLRAYLAAEVWTNGMRAVYELVSVPFP